jgi:cyclohexa-1,5-dienecarbonyl-CoA hydratase
MVLDAPHGNAITDAMIDALRAALRSSDPALKLITLEAAGADFSFGSSIDEHSPAQMRDVLPRFHAAILDLLRAPAVTAAVVHGRCLGGGLELALACDLMFAADDTVMGLPEIAIGAFPPVGSILLPLKAGASRASSAIVGGDVRPVSYWYAAGLIEAVAPRDELGASVDRWYAETLARHSAAALRRAATASRMVILRAMETLIPEMERLYLDDLISTADAAEGVAAFLDKRPPKWTNS